MDFVKQYLTQCINAAANNLRLNSEKIEVVTHIKEFVSEAENLEEEIREMKKITELSKFAIKLGDIYNFVGKNKIDFLKISDKFKEHSHSLVRDLGILLDRVNPDSYKQIETKLKEEHIQQIEICKNDKCEEKSESEIKVKEFNLNYTETKRKNNKLKDEIILEFQDKQGEFVFQNFEGKILNPIKDLDLLLKDLSESKINEDLLEKNYQLMSYNAKLSEAIGFDIISNMHRIFAESLKYIKTGDLVLNKEIVECMRACLIVIVAVIKGKEVDITNYLAKAENFGDFIYNNFNVTK